MKAFESFLNQFIVLPEDAKLALTQLFSPIQLRKGEYFGRTGEPAKKLGFLTSGVMRAYYRSPKGDEYNKVFFKDSSIVGAYSSLITKGQSLINIECLTDCELLHANFQDILNLYDTFPSIERLNRIMAEDFFVRMERKEIELVMLEASDRYRIFQEEYEGLENLIPQYQIASYLGITPTQLSRIRAKR